MGHPILRPPSVRRRLCDEFRRPPSALTKHEALVESDRCYFCYEAPCMQACPTSIDIPLFIRQIMAGNPKGAAKTIFSENILGGMCARVCPTETLCEEACVRTEAEGKPVKIGQLQRFATDAMMDAGEQPFSRGRRPGNSSRSSAPGRRDLPARIAWRCLDMT